MSDSERNEVLSLLYAVKAIVRAAHEAKGGDQTALLNAAERETDRAIELVDK